MNQSRFTAAGPSLIIAAGLIGSTLLAVLAADSRWLVMTGPLLLAMSFVAADMLASRLGGSASGPSRTTLLLGGTIMLASLMVALRDPALVKLLLPTIAGPIWVTVLLRTQGKSRACCGW